MSVIAQRGVTSKMRNCRWTEHDDGTADINVRDPVRGVSLHIERIDRKSVDSIERAFDDGLDVRVCLQVVEDEESTGAREVAVFDLDNYVLGWEIERRRTQGDPYRLKLTSGGSAFPVGWVGEGAAAELVLSDGVELVVRTRRGQ